MATLGRRNGPWADHYHSIQSSTTTLFRQLFNRRAIRARPTRALFLTIATFLALTIFLLRSPSQVSRPLPLASIPWDEITDRYARLATCQLLAEIPILSPFSLTARRCDGRAILPCDVAEK